MAIVTYPLDGIEYDATDAAGYFATRQSGVYSADRDFAVAAAGGTNVTVSAGVAWIHPDRWTGYSILCREGQTVQLPAADGIRARIDRIVLRYDAVARKTSLLVLEGTPDSGTPTAPEITRTALVYDLCLAEITRKAGSTAVTSADITDTRADEAVCGVMRDGVTGIPTAELLKQARARIAELEETASDSAAAAGKSAKAAAASQSAAAGSASTASTAASAAAGSASAAQEAAGTATTQATAATRQATAAASSASAAKASEDNAKTSETESAKNLQGTKEYFEQVRTITIGAQGWYATPDDLKAAVPTGENGWWAVIGTTDTIWTWDGDTGAWKDSVQKADLSDYLTQTQIKKLLEDYMPLRAATSAVLGGVKLSDDFTADEDGTLHLAGGTAPEPYPVGSIYQSTNAASPAALFGGTWEQIASERVLMGASSIHAAGTTAEAGLPNITGTVRHDNNGHGMMTANSGNTSGSFYAGASTAGKLGTYSGTAYELCFDASRSSAVYGRSSTVQPATYYVYIWHRVA